MQVDRVQVGIAFLQPQPPAYDRERWIQFTPGAGDYVLSHNMLLARQPGQIREGGTGSRRHSTASPWSLRPSGYLEVVIAAGSVIRSHLHG